MDDESTPTPWARATIARGTITLNPWSPHLVRGGPLQMVLDRLDGVVLADLTSHFDEDEEELIVRFVSPSPHPPEAVDALVAWAGTVGYRRAWLPGRVVDLEAPGGPIGAASVDCPTCGLTWRDETPEFWRHVYTAGAFPAFCVACGGSLPEWHVEEDAGAVAPGVEEAVELSPRRG